MSLIPTIRGASAPLGGLLIAVGVFHLVTMPRFVYPGDNAHPRAEAIRLVQDGELGLRFEATGLTELQDVLRSRGSCLYENDAKRRLYSKFGIGNTLLYLPP